MTLRIKAHRRAGVSSTTSERASAFILLWWFMPIYMLLPIPFLNGTVIAFVRYLAFVMLFGAMIICGKNTLKPAFVIFAVCYLFFAVLNIFIVSYHAYAAVESLTAFITFLAPVFYFSQTNALEFGQIMRRMYLWSMFHLLFLAYLLYFQPYIGYGDFATLTACTTLPLYIGAFHYKIHRRIGAICFLLSFASMSLFGSRAPIIAVMVVILAHQILFQKHHAATYAFILVLSVLAVMVVFNLKDNLLWLNQLLLSHGIQSRTIMKFSFDFGSKTWVEMLQSSNRAMIWELTLKEIVKFHGLPLGFGRIRYLTSGEFYFSHNLFLDITVYFGFFSLLIVGAFFVRLCKVRGVLDRENFITILLLLIYFLLCSMTGSNLLSDQSAVLVWSCVFFSQTRKRVLDSVRIPDTGARLSVSYLRGATQ